MRLRTQIFIDRAFFGSFNLLLGGFFRLAGALFERRPAAREFSVIAVCKWKGMGSIVQATPLLATLRRRFPEAKLVFVTTRANEALLKKISCVDEVLTLDDASPLALALGVPRLLAALRARRVDLYLDLEIYSDFSGTVAVLSGAAERLGFCLRSSPYRGSLYTATMFFNAAVPVRDVYLQLVRPLGIVEQVRDLWPLAWDGANVSSRFTEWAARGRYVLVNPNASDLRVERRWPAAGFQELITKLLATSDVRVCLVGSPGERAYVAALAREVGASERVLDAAGATNIDELLFLIAGAAVVVTNDTGPMHLAFALDRPVAALFGPASPAQFGREKDTFIAYKRVYCSPCVHDFLQPPCRGNNICMKLIEVGEVLEGVRCLLEGKPCPAPASGRVAMEEAFGLVPGFVVRDE